MLNENEEKIYKCPNCKEDNPDYAKYCLHCGQKVRPLKVRIWEFIVDFLDVAFNLDNRFIRTVRHLFIPAKLTKAFFRGERQSYYHPSRIYLLAIIIFFAILSIIGTTNIINISDNEIDIKTSFEKSQLINNQKKVIISTLDSLKEVPPYNQNVKILDSLSNNLFFVINNDTISLKDSLKNSPTDFNLFKTEIVLTREELVAKPIDDVVNSKNLDHWIERLALRQFIKSARDFESFNNFLYANLTWLFIALIPIFSLWMKLLYIRRKRYYLEHFVFLLHLFSGVILLSGVCLLLGQIEENEMYALGVIVAIVIIFPFMAIKRYYGQSRFKTFIKFLILGLLFLLSFILTFSVFVLVTAALF